MASEAKSCMIVWHRIKIGLRYSAFQARTAEMERLVSQGEISVDLTEFDDDDRTVKEEVEVVQHTMNYYINNNDCTLQRTKEKRNEEGTQIAKVDKLDLPDFYGDSLELDSLERTFKHMMDTCRYNEESKTMHLRRHIKGEAAEFLGTEGIKHMSYGEIWRNLNRKYGQEWEHTRESVSQMFDLEPPTNDRTQIEICK